MLFPSCTAWTCTVGTASSRQPSLLQCNTYLRLFPNARQGTSICIDPGSQFDAPVIDANLNSLIGGGGLDFITVNHQDPDVTGNLSALCHSNPAATVMLTEDTWRLVQHLRVRPGGLQFPPALGSSRQTLPGGIAWKPVPTPSAIFAGLWPGTIPNRGPCLAGTCSAD